MCLFFPDALQAGRKLRSDFTGVTVAELMKDAAVLVDHAVIGMDQMEELVAR